MTNALKNRVLGLFDPIIAKNLTGFAEHISNIDADYLVFMARKSLRFYDVMSMIGLPRSPKIVLSDRVLEFDPEPLRGKRIALIDDSLIVGTTLAKTKNRLEKSIGALVSSHVFCVDSDWWVRDVFQPDVTFMQLDNAQVMTFCTSEVKSLSALGVPYLLDFPFSLPVTVSSPNQLFTTMEWDGHNLSTSIQEEWGACAYTFLPSGAVLSSWERALGREFASLIDIAKVRAFGRSRSHDGRTKSPIDFVFVPIVTLKPLKAESLDRIFNVLVRKLSANSCAAQLTNSFTTPIGKARFIQYALSVAFGEDFLRTIAKKLTSDVHIGFQVEEAARHFGPWLTEDILCVHQNAHTSLLGGTNAFAELGSIEAEPTPARIVAAVRDVLDVSPATLAEKKATRAAADSSQDLLTDFSEIFIDLYDKHEIPARREAKAKGRLVLQEEGQSIHRDRLNIGIPWSQIVEYLCKLYDLVPSARVSNVISLLLDFWNDIGVAVPIFCNEEGVILRAYRHGEDVKITNQTIALVRELAVGFTEGGNKESIPRLTFEKLIVSLFRVGLARDWFNVCYTPTCGDGAVARVGYNLKGAVIFRPGRTESVFARSKEGWLSDYCVARGAVVEGRLKGDRQYRPGNPVDANFERKWVPKEARQLGTLYSTLALPSGPLSDEKKQILLTTCTTPHDVAGAMEAELLTMAGWCDAELPVLLSSISMRDADSIVAALEQLRRSFAHEAMFSARMKYLGYLDGASKSVSDECYTYLQGSNSFAAEAWKNYWLPVLTTTDQLEADRFIEPLRSAASVVLRFATCLLLLEFSLIIAERTLRGLSPKPLKRFFDKLDNFLQGFRSRLLVDGRTANILARLDSIRAVDDYKSLKPQAVLDFAVQTMRSTLPDIMTDADHLFQLYSKTLPTEFATYYSYLVWYDVIGSTGERFELKGADLDAHRTRVADFQNLVTIALDKYQDYVVSQNGWIKSWNGTIQSDNDEKHLFVGGAESTAQSFAEEAVRLVLRQTHRFSAQGPLVPAIRVRIILIPCTFAGSRVWLSKDGSEVVGKRFWPHWARLRDQLKMTNDKFEVGENILHGCGEELISVTQVQEFASLHNARTQDVNTKPDGYSLTTRVCGWNAEVI